MILRQFFLVTLMFKCHFHMLISLVQLSTKQISIPFGRDGPVSAKLSTDVVLISILNPLTLKLAGFWDVFFFGEMKFALSNFLSKEDLSNSYEN